MAETRRLQDQLKRFHLEKVKIGPRFANVELRFRDADRQAAWGLYVEMLTRGENYVIRSNVEEGRSISAF